MPAARCQTNLQRSYCMVDRCALSGWGLLIVWDQTSGPKGTISARTFHVTCVDLKLGDK